MLVKTLKETRELMGKAILAMRETGVKITEAEAKNEPTAELDEKFAKAQADFERFNKRVQALERAIETERDFETVVNPVGGASGDAAQGGTTPTDRLSAAKVAHREAFALYVKGHVAAAYEKLSGLGPAEKHALLGTQGQYGGFLVPEDFRAEVVKNLAGITVMRMAGARTVPVSGTVLVYPSIAGGTDPYSTTFAGNWRAEGEQGTDGTAPAQQTAPTFATERIPIHVWQPNAVIITRELMDDSAAPLESIIAQCIAETKGQDEDYAFLMGDGIGRPRGIHNYIEATSGPAITAVHTGSISAYTYDGLLDLIHTLPIQYRANAAFFMRSTTFASILKLKDSTQMPILYNGLPDNLFGKRVFISEHMPSIQSAAYTAIYGDPRFYCIAERGDLRVQRLDERFAPNVAFLPTARLGGGVLRTAAFVAAQNSV